MSDTIEARPDSTAPVAVRAALPTTLAADNADILGKLERELSGFVGDITTKKGREEIASKARKAAVAKMDLKRLASSLKTGHQEALNGIRAEEKVIEERLDALRDAIRAPLDAFEARETARVQGHESALAEIESWAVIPEDWTGAQVTTRIEELKAHPHLERPWEEYETKAKSSVRNAYNALIAARVTAQEREAEAARLVEEERQRAEAETLRLAQEQRAREERAAREAAEAATRAAEAKAQRE